MNEHTTAADRKNIRRRLFEIIFEADSPAGKAFDIVLIICILISVIVVMLDSIADVNARHGRFLNGCEWFFTIIFTIEYILRLSCIGQPLRYARSFFGIVDLLAIIPTYLSLIIPGSHVLISIRILRVLRIFRVLKLAQYVSEANVLMRALRASARKIFVFLFTVILMVVIIGSMMYIVEGPTESLPDSGFTSIPRSIYWAVVTLTTVGYGDISPQTTLGQFFASIVMIIGYAIIAVPTGIVTVEMAQQVKTKITSQVCPSCSCESHDRDAEYCKYCGEKL